MKTILIAALLSAAASPSFAACDATCQQKCQQSAPDNYEQCVAQWSVINARMGMNAGKCVFKIPLSVPASQLTKKHLMQACQ